MFFRAHRFSNKNMPMKSKNTIHPSDDLRKAIRNLTERIRKEDEAYDMETDRSFRLVMERVKAAKRHSKQRRLYVWAASAAAVIGILFAVNRWMGSGDTAPELNIALLNDTVAVQNDQVTLIAGNQALNLKDNASLQYDASGSSNAGQYALNQQTLPAQPSETHTLVVPRGKRANVVFSDGTRICINSGSRVVYPDVFDNDKREILVSGEVYLDVAQNPDRPFIVKTKGFDIRVLGTAFNVSAYDQEAAASVVLVRGSVQVSTGMNRKARLEPNQLVNIEGNELSVRQVDVAEYISWKDNLLLANEKPLPELFRKLELYYDCRIRYVPEVAALSLNGKLDLLPTVEAVLDNLCVSFPICYRTNESHEIEVNLK